MTREGSIALGPGVAVFSPVAHCLEATPKMGTATRWRIQDVVNVLRDLAKLLVEP